MSKWDQKGKLFLGIELEINSGCNMACSYCPNSSLERAEQGEMEDQLFLKIMDQLKDLNYQGRVCYHFYNEPMLCSKLNKFVRQTKENLPQCRTELFTNATMLTKSKFEELVDDGIDKFTITKHEDVKPNYVFDKTLASLSEEQKRLVMYKNYEELVYTNRGGLVDFGFSKKEPPYQLPCYIPTCSLVVTVKGNIVTCYEDYNQELIMGNVNDTHLGDIWFSKKYQDFRNDLKKGNRANHPVCSKCNNVQIIQ